MAPFRLALAVALFSLATHAFAQTDGFYVSAAYLMTFAGATDFEVGAKPATTAAFSANRTGTGTFHVGVLGLHAAVGYRIFGFRPEVEGSYRQLELSDYQYASFTQAGVKLPGAALDSLNKSIEVTGGNLTVLTLMANIWYDIDTATPFSPYLGGGMGAGQITLDAAGNSQIGSFEFPAATAWAFAYQAGAGVGFEIVERLVASAGYRVLGTLAMDLSWNEKGRNTDEVLRASILHHNVALGISYRF